MTNIFVVVPNLDRRPDKWMVCRERLLMQGIPDTHIIRYPAIDGREYYNENDAEDSRALIEQIGRTWTPIPAWLNHPTFYISELAWNYTWYMCLETIAQSPASNYYILLIDDCELKIGYSELCEHIGNLSRVSKHNLLIVQLSIPRHPCCRKLVGGCDVFQHGLGGTCDMALLFSPVGASYLRHYANRHPDGHDPCQLTKILAMEPSQAGIFALSATSCSTVHGFARLYYDPRVYNEHKYGSDRRESRRIKKGRAMFE